MKISLEKIKFFFRNFYFIDGKTGSLIFSLINIVIKMQQYNTYWKNYHLISLLIKNGQK